MAKTIHPNKLGRENDKLGVDQLTLQAFLEPMYAIPPID